MSPRHLALVEHTLFGYLFGFGFHNHFNGRIRDAVMGLDDKVSVVMLGEGAVRPCTLPWVPAHISLFVTLRAKRLGVPYGRIVMHAEWGSSALESVVSLSSPLRIVYDRCNDFILESMLVVSVHMDPFRWRMMGCLS